MFETMVVQLQLPIGIKISDCQLHSPAFSSVKRAWVAGLGGAEGENGHRVDYEPRLPVVDCDAVPLVNADHLVRLLVNVPSWAETSVQCLETHQKNMAETTPILNLQD